MTLYSETKLPAYVNRINILRGCSLIAIVLYHTDLSIFRHFYYGVDLFLFISGFVIYRRFFSSHADIFSFREFYSSRALRLIPSLVIVIGVFSALLNLVNLPEETLSTSKEVLTSILGISNFYYLHHIDYFSGTSSFNGFIHTWSLGLEEQFYIVLPISLLLIRKSNRKLTKPIVFGLTFAFSIYFSYRMEFLHPGIDFYMLPGRLFEFQSGIATSILFSKGLFFKNRFVPLTSIVVITTIFLYTPFPDDTSNQLILMCFSSVLILSNNIDSRFISAHLNRFITKTGIASYSIYLLHQPIFVLARLSSTAKIGILKYVVLIFLTFITGFWMTKYIEKPIRESRRKNIVLALIFFLVTLVACEQYLISQNAASERKLQAGMFESDSKNIKILYNWGTCFLSADQVTPRKVQRCLGSTSRVGGQAFIWGDSHAASIGVGMHAIDSRFTFLSVASCPAMFTISANSDCRRANQLILNELESNPPKILILAGDWQTRRMEISSDLYSSVRDITQKLDTSKIVIVGPLPHWTPSLSQQIWRLKLNRQQRKNLVVSDPEAMEYSIKQLELVSDSLGIEYINPSQSLCKNYSCPAILGRKTGYALTVFDDVHLTLQGSILYGRRILDILNQN